MGPFATFQQWLFNPCADRKSGWLQEFSAYKTKNHSLNESTKENIPINLYQLYTYCLLTYCIRRDFSLFVLSNYTTCCTHIMGAETSESPSW